MPDDNKEYPVILIFNIVALIFIGFGFAIGWLYKGLYDLSL